MRRLSRRCWHLDLVLVSINVRRPRRDVNNFVDRRCHVPYIGRMAKTKHIGVRLSPIESDALTRAAAKDERKVAALARKIIAEWLRASGDLKGDEQNG